MVPNARPDNPVTLENRRPGTPDWQLTHPALGREIEGYASATSINRGESIALFVNTQAPSYRLEVFRMGWYQGLGARRVFGPESLEGHLQPMPEMDPTTGLTDCNWHHPFLLTAANPADPDDWPSGIYLARLTESEGGRQSYIIFAVRDDHRHAELLVQQSVTTYQAYNPWGGKSLYKWSSTEHKRARKLSFNRPYAANPENPAAATGMGAGEFLTNLQPHPDGYGISNAGWECNMVRFLEREGYDVAYCTNLDTHNHPELLLGCRGWLSVGHDEYWSRAMRDHVEQARDGGVHLAFFSANTAYWQVRLEASPATGAADRVMVCYKGAARDPLASDQPTLATDQWRKPPILRPEESLLGVMYTADPVDGDIVVRQPRHWIFEGCGLMPGARLAGLLGYEVDCVQGHGPARLEILAESPWTCLNDPARQGISHMTLYQAESGALVFAAGTIQWSWGLDDFNAQHLRTSRLNSAAQQLTRNILRRFVQKM